MPAVEQRKRAPARDATVHAVLQSFNTWAFKREQPSNPELLESHIAAAVTRHSPVPFVLYWGKGPRSTIAQPDIQCLNYLGSMSQRIAAAYAPGAHFTLICTDTHALHNGHSPLSIQEYFSGIGKLAGEQGFSSCRLGSLSPLSALGQLTPIASDIPSESLQRLIGAAERWYRGDASIEQGALRYYRMNMVEKRAVERAFPDAIFVTFNGSEYRMLFPDALPIFYMYSIKRGVAVKPWFIEDPRGASPSSPIVGDAAHP